MTATSRREARETGARTYFTGKPCPQGHIDLRWTSNSSCRQCHRDASHEQWVKLKAGPPELLAWHYARQRSYETGEAPPERPVVSETTPAR